MYSSLKHGQSIKHVQFTEAWPNMYNQYITCVPQKQGHKLQPQRSSISIWSKGQTSMEIKYN